MPPTETFDFVIVGAGTAGCVLADRLSEDGKNSVLVLEVGGSDRSIFVQMPSALSIPMGMKKYNWFYYTEPEPGLGGRRIHTPRGKVLGGSSSINGLVYIRGNAEDFDYDCVFTTKSPPAIRWQGVNYNSLVQFSAAVGDEVHGITNPPVFLNPAAHDFYLPADSPLQDKGVHLPGVNDNYMRFGMYVDGAGRSYT